MMKMKTTTNKEKYKDYTNDDLYKQYADTKDVNIRNELVVRNQPLVNYVIGKYYFNRNLPEETKQEIHQEGCLGLLQAIEGYDHTLGFKFSTYAVWWIKQAVNNYLINIRPVIRVPNHVKAAQNKLQKRLELDDKSIRDLSDINPSEYDISEKMLRSIESALKSRQVTSLNKPKKWDDSGSTSTLEDCIEDETSVYDENIDSSLLVNAMKKALKAMPKKRRLILLLRYNIIDENVIKKELKKQ